MVDLRPQSRVVRFSRPGKLYIPEMSSQLDVLCKIVRHGDFCDTKSPNTSGTQWLIRLWSRANDGVGRPFACN